MDAKRAAKAREKKRLRNKRRRANKKDRQAVAEKLAVEQAALEEQHEANNKKKQQQQQQKDPLVKQEAEEEAVEIQYVADTNLDLENPTFQRVFERFARPEQLLAAGLGGNQDSRGPGDDQQDDAEDDAEDGEEDEDEDEDGEYDGDGQQEGSQQTRLGKKARKEAKRLKVAVLKQLVPKPDLVELHDVTAADPMLLVTLKGVRNAVPVPKHWSQKRKYLQNKRGTEKPPFELPKFIADTGITGMREAVTSKDADKTSKQRARERTQPKMHQIDLDYQALHDAFFRYQTKPDMSGHGDMYYEGKEFEADVKNKRPGRLSEELREALGMPEGAPPPWLINMQRFGPPPSYANLRIPGLNAPIPHGADWGFHAGGWGEPPVNMHGQPLYGDVYAQPQAHDQTIDEPPPAIVAQQWGSLLHEDLVDSSDDSMDGEGESSPAQLGDAMEDDDDAAAAAMEDDTSGLDSRVPDGMASVPLGLETPTSDAIELRKARVPKAGLDQPVPPPPSSAPKPLFQVLEQRDASVAKNEIHGSAYSYVIPTAEATEAAAAAASETGERRVDLMKSQATSKEVITLKPSDLEDMAEGNAAALLKAKYEARLAEKQMQGPGGVRSDDVSKVIADHAAKKKRKKQKEKSKYKDYKF